MIDVEKRAARIIATVLDTFRQQQSVDVLNVLNVGERVGWEAHKFGDLFTPTDAEQWTGWLAREAIYGEELDAEIEEQVKLANEVITEIVEEEKVASEPETASEKEPA